MIRSCRRLIEVDLPIKTISDNARHEQNVRKGHIHSIHIWWATRPLAACRAVVLSTLLPDPLDPDCLENFKKNAWSLLRPLSVEAEYTDLALREALFNYVGDFSAWETSNNPHMIEIARELVKWAHPKEAPFVVDPFAGIGSIPFEALRIGSEAMARDLNPVAALLLRAIDDYVPRYGEALAKEIAYWGSWVRERAIEELQEFYPKERDGSTPLTYIWARTVRCEGPECGAEIPLIGMLWLSQKENKVALRYKADMRAKEVLVEIFHPISERDLQDRIVKRFQATCPVCGYTTSYDHVREQIRKRRGGTQDSRLIAVVTLNPDGSRNYRVPAENDVLTVERAQHTLERINRDSDKPFLDEPTPEARGPGASRGFSVNMWGIRKWSQLYTPRQSLALQTLARIVKEAHTEILKKTGDKWLSEAITTFLALAVSNHSHYMSSVSIWASDHMISAFIQGTSLPMRPDFAEANPLMPKLVGGFEYSLENIVNAIEREGVLGFNKGIAQQGAAQSISLPDESVLYVVTDPPYYDAAAYGDLSDFCYVWLKRMLLDIYPDLFKWRLTPKAQECILDPGPPRKGEPEKAKSFFEKCIYDALTECRRILKPDGLAVVVFAHKGTAGWEALLKALIGAGWTVTGSWSIQTERGARMRAHASATLASSVFLVCRPRESEATGEWRDVIAELQPRVHEWMQRLTAEGIVGADAMFACIGPALEIFSRYDGVETAGGKKIELDDYLQYVWAAVAKDALNMIFKHADPTGFEQDSRLTALWLWTLRTNLNDKEDSLSKADINTEQPQKKTGYSIEYDAARLIAQGLGVHLEELSRPGGILKVKGNMATLLPVRERRNALLGRSHKTCPDEKPIIGQTTLAGTLETSNSDDLGDLPEQGKTTLDCLHQAMLIFAEGRTGLLKRFLTEGDVGRQDQFWRLAQALSALYPINSEEKRWVDGVLTRQKVLGF